MSGDFVAIEDSASPPARCDAQNMPHDGGGKVTAPSAIKVNIAYRAERRAAARAAGVNWRDLPRVPDLTTRKVKKLKVRSLEIEYLTFTYTVGMFS